MFKKMNFMSYVQISNQTYQTLCAFVRMLCFVSPTRMLRPPAANRSDGGKSRDSPYQRFRDDSVTQALGEDHDPIWGVSDVTFVPITDYPVTENS